MTVLHIFNKGIVFDNIKIKNLTMRTFDFMDLLDSVITTTYGEFPYFSKLNYDINDIGDYYELDIALPGYLKEDIDISINNRILILECKTEENSYWRKPFKKLFTLSSDIDNDKIKTSFKDGILRFQLFKLDKVKPKKIKIE